MTEIIYSDEFLKHDNPNHPECADRLKSIIKGLRSAPFYDELKFVEPEAIDEELMKKIHSESMIDLVKDKSERGGWLDPDTYVCVGSYEIAMLAAGGLNRACDNAIKNGENAFALIRPPSHHATKNRSMGFCLFNSVAIATNAVAEKGKKLLIFDHDVHHGNGTCEIFYDRDDVLYSSFHLSPHYPGTGSIDEIGKGDGEGFTVNAPLPRGIGDNGVRMLLDEIFIPIARQFDPDLIIFSAGFDSHHADLLGGLRLTTNFFGEMVKKFKEIANVVCSLEGGYNLPYLRNSVASEIGELNDTPIEFDDEADEVGDIEPIINQLKKIFNQYWDL